MSKSFCSAAAKGLASCRTGNKSKAYCSEMSERLLSCRDGNSTYSSKKDHKHGYENENENIGKRDSWVQLADDYYIYREDDGYYIRNPDNGAITFNFYDECGEDPYLGQEIPNKTQCAIDDSFLYDPYTGKIVNKGPCTYKFDPMTGVELPPIPEEETKSCGCHTSH